MHVRASKEVVGPEFRREEDVRNSWCVLSLWRGVGNWKGIVLRSLIAEASVVSSWC